MLSELKEKKDNLVKLVKTYISEIEVLEKDEKVKRYKELSNSYSKNLEELKKLNLQVEEESMRECSHIFVIDKIDKSWDGHRTDTYKYRGCIKCGLDGRYSSCDYIMYASPLQQKMESIYIETAKNGIFIDETCSLELGMAIYRGILKAHPNISDEKAIKYFHATLHNIRTKEVTENVEKSRVKRLGLYPNFKAWNQKSVISRN